MSKSHREVYLIEPDYTQKDLYNEIYGKDGIQQQGECLANDTLYKFKFDEEWYNDEGEFVGTNEQKFPAICKYIRDNGLTDKPVYIHIYW